MPDRNLKERIRYFQRIGDEYGNEVVSATRVYEIAIEVIRPDEMGLSELNPGYYAASSEHDIVQLLKLFPTKGASYHVRWGLSLGYVPHKWNPKLRWHRTLKSARFDVWENAFDYFDLEQKHWREWEKFLVSKLNGETFLRKQMNEMWTRLAQTVQEWFASTITLSGVLSAIDRQTEREGASSHHFPPPSLVRAFTLSRTGEIQEARLALRRYLHDSDAGAVDRENLSAALESVAEP